MEYVLHEGWLEQRSHHVGRWKRRYFVLFESGLLKYWRHKPEVEKEEIEDRSAGGQENDAAAGGGVVSGDHDHSTGGSRRTTTVPVMIADVEEHSRTSLVMSPSRATTHRDSNSRWRRCSVEGTTTDDEAAAAETAPPPLPRRRSSPLLLETFRIKRTYKKTPKGVIDLRRSSHLVLPPREIAAGPQGCRLFPVTGQGFNFFGMNLIKGGGKNAGSSSFSGGSGSSEVGGSSCGGGSSSSSSASTAASTGAKKKGNFLDGLISTLGIEPRRPKRASQFGRIPEDGVLASAPSTKMTTINSSGCQISANELPIPLSDFILRPSAEGTKTCSKKRRHTAFAGDGEDEILLERMSESEGGGGGSPHDGLGDQGDLLVHPRPYASKSRRTTMPEPRSLSSLAHHQQHASTSDGRATVQTRIRDFEGQFSTSNRSNEKMSHDHLMNLNSRFSVRYSYFLTIVLPNSKYDEELMCGTKEIRNGWFLHLNRCIRRFGRDTSSLFHEEELVGLASSERRSNVQVDTNSETGGGLTSRGQTTNRDEAARSITESASGSGQRITVRARKTELPPPILTQAGFLQKLEERFDVANSTTRKMNYPKFSLQHDLPRAHIFFSNKCQYHARVWHGREEHDAEVVGAARVSALARHTRPESPPRRNGRRKTVHFAFSTSQDLLTPTPVDGSSSVLLGEAAPIDREDPRNTLRRSRRNTVHGSLRLQETACAVDHFFDEDERTQAGASTKMNNRHQRRTECDDDLFAGSGSGSTAVEFRYVFLFSERRLVEPGGVQGSSTDGGAPGAAFCMERDFYALGEGDRARTSCGECRGDAGTRRRRSSSAELVAEKSVLMHNELLRGRAGGRGRSHSIAGRLFEAGEKDEEKCGSSTKSVLEPECLYLFSQDEAQGNIMNKRINTTTRAPSKLRQSISQWKRESGMALRRTITKLDFTTPFLLPPMAMSLAPEKPPQTPHNNFTAVRIPVGSIRRVVVDRAPEGGEYLVTIEQAAGRAASSSSSSSPRRSYVLRLPSREHVDSLRAALRASRNSVVARREGRVGWTAAEILRRFVEQYGLDGESSPSRTANDVVASTHEFSWLRFAGDFVVPSGRCDETAAAHTPSTTASSTPDTATPTSDVASFVKTDNHAVAQKGSSTTEEPLSEPPEDVGAAALLLDNGHQLIERVFFTRPPEQDCVTSLADLLGVATAFGEAAVIHFIATTVIRPMVNAQLLSERPIVVKNGATSRTSSRQLSFLKLLRRRVLVPFRMWSRDLERCIARLTEMQCEDWRRKLAVLSENCFLRHARDGFPVAYEAREQQVEEDEQGPEHGCPMSDSCVREGSKGKQPDVGDRVHDCRLSPDHGLAVADSMEAGQAKTSNDLFDEVFSSLSAAGSQTRHGPEPPSCAFPPARNFEIFEKVPSSQVVTSHALRDVLQLTQRIVFNSAAGGGDLNHNHGERLVALASSSPEDRELGFEALEDMVVGAFVPIWREWVLQFHAAPKVYFKHQQHNDNHHGRGAAGLSSSSTTSSGPFQSALQHRNRMQTIHEAPAAPASDSAGIPRRSSFATLGLRYDVTEHQAGEGDVVEHQAGEGSSPRLPRDQMNPLLSPMQLPELDRLRAEDVDHDHLDNVSLCSNSTSFSDSGSSSSSSSTSRMLRSSADDKFSDYALGNVGPGFERRLVFMLGMLNSLLESLQTARTEWAFEGKEVVRAELERAAKVVVRGELKRMTSTSRGSGFGESGGEKENDVLRSRGGSLLIVPRYEDAAHVDRKDYEWRHVDALGTRRRSAEILFPIPHFRGASASSTSSTTRRGARPAWGGSTFLYDADDDPFITWRANAGFMEKSKDRVQNLQQLMSWCVVSDLTFNLRRRSRLKEVLSSSSLHQESSSKNDDLQEAILEFLRHPLARVREKLCGKNVDKQGAGAFSELILPKVKKVVECCFSRLLLLEAVGVTTRGCRSRQDVGVRMKALAESVDSAFGSAGFGEGFFLGRTRKPGGGSAAKVADPQPRARQTRRGRQDEGMRRTQGQDLHRLPAKELSLSNLLTSSDSLPAFPCSRSSARASVDVEDVEVLEPVIVEVDDEVETETDARDETGSFFPGFLSLVNTLDDTNATTGPARAVCSFALKQGLPVSFLDGLARVLFLSRGDRHEVVRKYKETIQKIRTDTTHKQGCPGQVEAEAEARSVARLLHEHLLRPLPIEALVYDRDRTVTGGDRNNSTSRFCVNVCRRIFSARRTADPGAELLYHSSSREDGPHHHEDTRNCKRREWVETERNYFRRILTVESAASAEVGGGGSDDEEIPCMNIFRLVKLEDEDGRLSQWRNIRKIIVISPTVLELELGEDGEQKQTVIEFWQLHFADPGAANAAWERIVVVLEKDGGRREGWGRTSDRDTIRCSHPSPSPPSPDEGPMEDVVGSRGLPRNNCECYYKIDLGLDVDDVCNISNIWESRTDFAQLVRHIEGPAFQKLGPRKRDILLGRTY